MSFEELNESELGTKEYWDERYKNEIRNYKVNGDVGDIWFGEDIAERIVNWLEKNVEKSSLIADVGCGNGMLLVDLARNGYKNLTGLDYSEGAITLAKEIMKENDFNVNLQKCDVLEARSFPSCLFDVVVDKGTYDAISLSKDAKTNREIYIENMFNALKVDGLLVLTSCNWTHDELEEQFKSKYEVACVIKTPQFKFGGKIGNVVSSLVFKKKH